MLEIQPENARLAQYLENLLNPPALESSEDSENASAPSKPGKYPPAMEPIIIPIIIMVFRDIFVTVIVTHLGIEIITS